MTTTTTRKCTTPACRTACKCTDCQTHRAMAHGVTTVCSMARPECHAPSGYSVSDYSGKAASSGIAPRDRMRDVILAFWESQGVAQWRNGGAGGGGAWFVRDVVNPERAGEWLPLARFGEDRRSDRGEFSHVRSTVHGGAWCGCGTVPENGASNASREGDDMTTLTPQARALLAAWPAWWRENVARKASLARL